MQTPTCPYCAPKGFTGPMDITLTGNYQCPKCRWHFTKEFFASAPIEEPKPCPTMTFRHLTWEQFRAEMLAAIIKHRERLTKEQICEDLMDAAKPALVPGNLSAFLEAMLFDYAPIAPCFVDSSDANLRYFFTGTEAILFTVPKP